MPHEIVGILLQLLNLMHITTRWFSFMHKLQIDYHCGLMSSGANLKELSLQRMTSSSKKGIPYREMTVLMWRFTSCYRTHLGHLRTPTFPDRTCSRLWQITRRLFSAAPKSSSTFLVPRNNRIMMTMMIENEKEISYIWWLEFPLGCVLCSHLQLPSSGKYRKQYSVTPSLHLFTIFRLKTLRIELCKCV